MTRKIPEASKAQLRQITTSLMRRIAATAKRDTNRYVRGFLMAGKELGAEVGLIPSVQPSKYAERIRELIQDQIATYAERLRVVQEQIDWMYPLGPPKKPRTTQYAEMFVMKQKWEKLLERSIAEVEKLNKGGDSTLLIGFLHSGQAQKGRKLITVRHKIYGGAGRFVDSHGTVYAVVINKEPHAKILEKKHRTFGNALSAVRSSVVGLDVRRQPFTKAMRAIHNG